MRVRVSYTEPESWEEGQWLGQRGGLVLASTQLPSKWVCSLGDLTPRWLPPPPSLGRWCPKPSLLQKLGM